MVLPIVSVFRFLRYTSAKTETQKKITYRSAAGWSTDCVSRVIKERSAMKNKYVMLIGLVALSLLVMTSVALASANSSKPAKTFPEMVRQATAQFKDVGKATGYELLHGCV